MRILSLLLLAFLTACSSEQILKVDVGKYQGKLPAADADHIHTTLTLKEDSTYFLRQIKVNGKNREFLNDEHGTYTFTMKTPKSVTEFKLGMLILKNNDVPYMKFKILSERKLEILDLNEEQVDIKKTYSLKKIE